MERRQRPGRAGAGDEARGQSPIERRQLDREVVQHVGRAAALAKADRRAKQRVILHRDPHLPRAADLVLNQKSGVVALGPSCPAQVQPVRRPLHRMRIGQVQRDCAGSARAGLRASSQL